MSNGLLGFTPTGMTRPIVETGTMDAASVPTTAAASLIQDPQARMRYYSQQMGIPMERFGVSDGRIVYRTDRGTLQAVSPGPLRSFVKGLGPSIPATGAALGTVGGSLFGPGGMVAGGTTGAMTGQYLREAMARQMAGQRISPFRVAAEGAIDLTASLTGMLIGKGLSRAAIKDAAKQFDRAIKQTGSTAANALKSTLDTVNRKYGTNIRITPAELTGNADLIAMQKALAGDPRTGETMAQFAAERGTQIGRAAGQAFEDIAPGAPPREVAGAQMARASEDAMVQLARDRARAGAPAYAEAFEKGAEVDVSRVVRAFEQSIKDNPRLGAKMRSALKFIATPVKNKEGTVVGYRPNKSVSLQFVQDNVKELMDDMIGAAKRAGRNKEALRLQEVQGTLLKEMDAQVSEYAGARKIWGDLSRPIDDVEGGILPLIANKNLRDFEYMGGRLFKNASPSSIAAAKANILKVDGGEKIWDSFTRGALESIWEGASKIRQGEISRPDVAASMAPARFWTDFGQGEGYKRLKAALSPDQMEAMDNLLKVMQASSRAIYTGTDTAAKESAQDLINKTGFQGLLQFASAPWRALGAASDATARQLQNVNVRKLADTITGEGSVETLKEIAAGREGGFFNERNLTIVGRALAQGGGIIRPMVTDGIAGREPAPIEELGKTPEAGYPGGASNPLNQ